MKKYKEIWNGIREQIKAMNKFNNNVRTVFEEVGKYYPQSFLDECLYEL